MLSAVLNDISRKCIKCNLCVKECEFLRRYGKPGEIAENYTSGKNTDLSMGFKCSLCCLCAAVCPVDIDPSMMFIEMRRFAVANSFNIERECKGILAYEKRGISKRYSWHGIPEGCDTVFFPGCTLPGTRPHTTLALFEHLRKTIPAIGIVFDCCTNISHDLGRQEFFQTQFQKMRRLFSGHGIKNVITACPSCYKIFNLYGEGLKVTSAYEVLSENFPELKPGIQKMAAVHDPCALRFNEGVQDAVRKLIVNMGLTLYKMDHSGLKTLCCGEGGSVKHLSPDLANKWAATRGNEADGNMVITYCAGCVNHLGKIMDTSHILDLIFNPEATLSGKARVSRAPMTYWNRIWLKRRIKKMLKRRQGERLKVQGE